MDVPAGTARSYVPSSLVNALGSSRLLAHSSHSVFTILGEECVSRWYANCPRILVVQSELRIVLSPTRNEYGSKAAPF